MAESKLIGTSPADLEPQIMLMGTCQTLRVKRVGAVYFLECLHQTRKLDANGVEIVEDLWKSFAVAKGPDAWQEAQQCLCRTNIQVMKTIQQDLAQKAIAKEGIANPHDRHDCDPVPEC